MPGGGEANGEGRILDSPEIAFIALGSNLGDRMRTCLLAIDAMRDLPGTRIDAVSPPFETEPEGPAGQPKFINMACKMATRLEPAALLSELQSIERRFGRKREERWGPRTLDLDILLFGSRVIDEPDLVVPHPHMHLRAFVLAPLARMAPDAVHPVLGLTVSQMLERLGELNGIRELDADPATRG